MDWALPLVLLAGYVLSLLLHPYVKCRSCNGSARHYGSFYGYARRNCHRCSGTGQRRRLGAWLLRVGRPSAQSSRFASRSD